MSPQHFFSNLEGVEIISKSSVTKVESVNGKLNLSLDNGETVMLFIHVIRLREFGQNTLTILLTYYFLYSCVLC